MVNFPKKPAFPVPGLNKVGTQGQGFAQNVAHKAQTAVEHAKEREIKQMTEALVRELESETNVAVNALKRRGQALTRFGAGAQPKMNGPNNAKLNQQLAELMQEEADIVNMILESKNQAIEQILRMMQQVFAA